MGAHRVAVVGGGIGTDVIEAGCCSVETLTEVARGVTFTLQRFDRGSNYFRRAIPEDELM
jgi:hypothetical protein